MVIIRELKSDIKSGYEWREYNGKYGKWDYTIQFTKHGNFVNGDILVYFENEKYYASAIIPVDDFSQMKKADFEKRCNEILFYNCIEKEVEEV